MRLAIVVALVATTVACSKVEPGYVGVRVSNFNERGVQGEIVLPGKYVYNGPGYQLYEFPTFKQNHVYEGMSFGTVEGLNVTANIGISYRVDPSLAPKLFQDYRKGVDEITATDLRNMLATELVNAASSRKVETIYGTGKAALIADVNTALKKKVTGSGIVVSDVYWSGNLTLPPEVQASITSKIKATQIAEQRVNELAQSEAEAAKKVAEAKGEADAKLLAARAEAEAIQIKGDALRNNPGLIELERVNAMKIAASRWSGQGDIVPKTVMGGDAGKNLIFQLPAQQ